MEIANFLYMNDIDYIYENPYKIDTGTREFGQYKPDFYLPEYFESLVNIITKCYHIKNNNSICKISPQDYKFSVIWFVLLIFSKVLQLLYSHNFHCSVIKNQA